MNRRLAIVAVATLGALTSVLAAVGQWRPAAAGGGILLAAVAVYVVLLSSRPEESRQEVAGLADRIANLEKSATSRQVAKQVSAAVKSQTREIEALLQLYRWVEPTAPMPPSGQWAMNPQGLLALVGLVRQNHPRVVVELGSGTSTVWLGYALAAIDTPTSDGRRLVSIDHEAAYADQSRESVRRHADQIAPTEVRHAPLVSVRLGDQDFDWYSLDVLKDLPAIDMLLIDGPPSRTGPLARYPAVPALIDQLSDGAVIVLDDATRDDEKEIAKRWVELSGITQEPSPIGRLAVFRYSAEARP